MGAAALGSQGALRAPGRGALLRWHRRGETYGPDGVESSWCGRPSAATAGQESQGLHGAGRGRLQPRLGSPGPPPRAEPGCHLPRCCPAPVRPGPAWWPGDSIPPHHECAVLRGVISTMIPNQSVLSQYRQLRLSGLSLEIVFRCECESSPLVPVDSRSMWAKRGDASLLA